MKSDLGSSVVGFARHDHRQCVVESLARAETHCREHGLRFTPVRRRTLGILLESHTALGAYDVLERLRHEGLGSKPPVAYRALGFLLDNGFIHRVERLNAFIACAHPGARHSPTFLICTDCGAVAEAPMSTVGGTLNRAAKQSGFAIEQTTMEAEGLCPDCLPQYSNNSGVESSG